ncbi:AMP-binding domain-containing protein [Burkholderia pseudomallei]|nr:AMP-binding domain-containing protein [Burkholderia pseudomallei]CAJ4036506.1 AMP-binding domain-containing protein [Burkholderia pseudomallei]CAJ5055596.1 AMP-binding domain-containing protein [Burkholderia pseudomallei]CAJ5088823.1 AMP-binding domain-containing protein [Burkholderia pseudomallei]CAJ5091711.1 AMP-binding domain-containing protein [Burkholderia pseudomallei]
MPIECRQKRRRKLNRSMSAPTCSPALYSDESGRVRGRRSPCGARTRATSAALCRCDAMEGRMPGPAIPRAARYTFVAPAPPRHRAPAPPERAAAALCPPGRGPHPIDDFRSPTGVHAWRFATSTTSSRSSACRCTRARCPPTRCRFSTSARRRRPTRPPSPSFSTPAGSTARIRGPSPSCAPTSSGRRTCSRASASARATSPRSCCRTCPTRISRSGAARRPASRWRSTRCSTARRSRSSSTRRAPRC